MSKYPLQFWSFNRRWDASSIMDDTTLWKGPFAWPGFGGPGQAEEIPDVSGVYLFTFEYLDGYILRSAGETDSTKRRFQDHRRKYVNGLYTVLDVAAGQKGERKEIWHGWPRKAQEQEHRAQFQQYQDHIRKCVNDELRAYRLFAADIGDKRKRQRVEAAIVMEAYRSKQPWADLIDGGMRLDGRWNNEIPISMSMRCESKIYGLPPLLEV